MKYKRLSTQKFNKILRCFYIDITATACAKIVSMNRNTVNKLMECEWRYNHRNEDLYKELTKILKRY